MTPIDYGKYEGHTPGPLDLRENSNFPFALEVINAQLDIVFSEPRMAYSFACKTPQDCMDGVGFQPGKAQQGAIEHNRRQLADMRLRADAPDLLAACKERDERIKELESLLGGCVGELACIPHSATGGEDRSALCEKIQATLKEWK